jgi:hypothetical protein
LMRLSSGAATLIWAAQPGAQYQVEYTDALGSAWQVLGVQVQVGASQATAIDPGNANKAARFYRITQSEP